MQSKKCRSLLLRLENVSLKFNLKMIALSSLILTKWLILPIILIFLTTYWMKLKFSYWKKRKVPHFKPSFPFGNVNIFNGTPSIGQIYNDFYKKAKAHGFKYAGYYMSIEPVFVAIDPECIKQLLIKDFPSFHARGFYHNEKDQPMSANIFTIDGPKWRTLRYKFSPTFTSGKIKYMYQLVLNCEKQLSEMISKHAKTKMPINIKDIISRYTTDTISSCAFGVDTNSFGENPVIHQNVTTCIEKSTTFLRFGCLYVLPNVCRFFKVGLFVGNYLKYFEDLIMDTFEQRKKNLVYRTDFLQMMKEMQDQKIPEFDVTLEEIKSQAFIFFLGGFETSSTAMTFLFLELAENPEIQEKLRNEINEVSEKHGGITFEALQEMKYLSCVVDETLRMYPPATVLNRRCTEDYTLPNGEILEKDTNIIIPNFAIQRDPEYYPNPEMFDPDRFTEENKAKRPPYTYLPFGDGPRNCIGSRFGLIQIKVAVSHLVKKFKFSVNKNMDTTRDYSSHFVLTLKRDVILDVEEVS
ncbi:cytochrome P450 6a8-like [Onthophagus taurus]|uniref:cytochrome P450 6a8-like n=1 Tax=Onthophagus taurus TaxID=166361 RepID=UPI0039BE642E